MTERGRPKGGRDFLKHTIFTSNMENINNDTKELKAVTQKIKDLRDAMKNDSLVTMGAMRACEELFEKHKEMIVAVREEMLGEIQKNNLTQDCANYSLKQLDKITQMIKKFSSDRLQHYYAKVGAMNAIESCIKILEFHQEEVQLKTNLNQLSETSFRSEEDSKIESLKNEVNEKKISNKKSNRPDDENTKMGKKLKEIKSRVRKNKT